MTFYYKYKKYLLLSSVFIILIVFIIIYFLNDQGKEKLICPNYNETTKIVNTFFVDVKGNVKKPGVYEFINGDKVIDAINMAGGLTKNAVTNNLNLSKKLTSEMVVYVFSKKDLTTMVTTNSCNCETIEVNNCISKEETTKNVTDGKVNINTASLNELTTISGIGESKAKSIIEYRDTNGSFKTIEDIKNISGIGDSLFDKIKDFITV